MWQRDVMLAATFLAVKLVRVQCKAAVTCALIASQSVVTLVLTSAIILGTLVQVEIVCCCEARAVD